MIRYLLKQPVHIWRFLGMRVKAELLVLLVIVFLYPAGRLQILFTGWINQNSVTPQGLMLFTVQAFRILVYLGGPFIFRYLVSRQKAVRIFYMRPLTPANALRFLVYYSVKYQLLTALLIAPVLWAIAVCAGWFAGLMGSFLFLIYLTAIVIFQALLLTRLGNNNRFVMINMTLLVFHSTLWFVMYHYTSFIWFYEIAVLMALFFISVIWLRSGEAIHLEKLYPPGGDFTIRKGITKIGRFCPPIRFHRTLPMYMLFRKEWLSMWRNSRYRRLKMMTFLVYIVCLLMIHFSATEYKEVWMLVLALGIHWIHYSNSFNEKYALPDPAWLLFNMPLRYHQLWLSKFIAEFIAVVPLLILLWVMLMLGRVNPIAQWYIILTVLLFALFVLAAVINFKILFYDAPRLAGYAFHFLIVFILVMSLNFRFVGPVIGLSLFLYYTYKSYRYFKA